MQTADSYRDKAGECMVLAERSNDPEMQAHWRHMAKEWIALANHADVQDALSQHLPRGTT